MSSIEVIELVIRKIVGTVGRIEILLSKDKGFNVFIRPLAA